MDREARAREQSLGRVVEMGPTKEGEIMEGFMRLKLAGHKQVLPLVRICDSFAGNARVCGPGLLDRCPSALTDENYVFVF